MKAVLLAAGQGTRLRPLTESLPKPLITVGDRTCLDIALESLSAVADNIIVVTGYLGDQVSRHLEKHPPSASVQVVISTDLENGNLTSLAAARLLIEGDDFIVTNADHIFPPDFYTNHFSKSENITIAAQSDRPILDDEMKVVVVKQHLREISKSLSSFDGAYIGTTRIPKKYSSAYWTAFDQVQGTISPERACVEDVLHRLAESEQHPEVVWVDKVKWFEIDTLDDLEKARKELS